MHTYTEVLQLIHTKNYSSAEKLLLSHSKQTDKWHYLYGLILIQKCWFESAKVHLETAIRLNPNSQIYKRTLAKFMGRSRSYSDDYYRSPHYRKRSGCCCCCCDDCCCEFDCCDLICADTCCECMGGDLISCI